MQKVACDLKEAQERKDLTILVVGSSHAVRALDVWFLRSSACVTGEKVAREAECLGFLFCFCGHMMRGGKVLFFVKKNTG